VKALANTLYAWGPAGLFQLALMDSAGVPIPGVIDALLVFLASRNPSLAFVYAGLAVAGSFLGCMFLYFLARKGGEAFLDKHTASGRGAMLRGWFQRYGLVTVYIPAISVIPMPMKIPVFCAGALGVRPVVFASVILAARLPRYLALAWLGSKMGEGTLGWIREHTWQIAAALAVLAAIGFLVVRNSYRLEGRHDLASSTTHSRGGPSLSAGPVEPSHTPDRGDPDRA
jgi:membrane protein YqaA with SNARE-associated domain